MGTEDSTALRTSIAVVASRQNDKPEWQDGGQICIRATDNRNSSTTVWLNQRMDGRGLESWRIAHLWRESKIVR